MSSDKIHMIGICGSLRKKSYNMSLLKIARDVVPPKYAYLDIYEGLGDIPLYNEDLLTSGDPEPVQKLRAAVQACHVLIIATPEYNYGVPGLLKNALDWLSVPAIGKQETVLSGKLVGVTGVSGGPFGTVRAQLSLRQILHATESLVMPKPELLIPRASTLFDSEHNLIDQELRDRVQRFMLSLIKWSIKMTSLK